VRLCKPRTVEIESECEDVVTSQGVRREKAISSSKRAAVAADAALLAMTGVDGAARRCQRAANASAPSGVLSRSLIPPVVLDSCL